MELIAAGVIFFSFGFGCAWVIRGQRSITHDDAQATSEQLHALEIEHATLQAELQRAETIAQELASMRTENTDLQRQLAALEAKMHENQKAQEEKIALLTQMREDMQKEMGRLSNEALIENRSKFIEIAKEKFAPIEETLSHYKEHMGRLEKERLETHAKLSAELQSVIQSHHTIRNETTKLVGALKAAPKTRGRWGEQTLQKVLEMAGLSDHCDFTKEETFDRGGDKLRPDVIVNLPGGRHLVIDAKTSLAGYLDAVEAESDDEREAHLDAHLRHVRTHVKQLANKSYWDNLTVTPDFVVMFIPGDNFYTAAIERDPNLFEDAAAQRVIITTPATLIALAKAVAYGWRQEKVAENAQKVHGLGRELYNRLGTMVGHITSMGKSLEGAVGHYNKFVGSLETKVMPQARRFNELEVEGTAAAIDSIEPIDKEPRDVQHKRLGVEKAEDVADVEHEAA
jgi:DNA recombination protein RmuC